jgi:DNA repair exonuclease SbcCD ATPase subunit
MDDGGGAKDIASIALRMAVWSICKTRALMILDEPCKFLSRGLQTKASEMLKMMSTELGIQIIMVSHVEEMITAADKVINVEKVDGISRVTVI